MKINGRRVLVTGGAGFIGSHLVDVLARQDNEVTVVDNLFTGSKANLAHHGTGGKVRLVECDVRDAKNLAKAAEGVDVVFHLATHCVRLSLTDPVTNHEVNATGTLNALLAAEKGRASRFVYCSSSEVYGSALAVGAKDVVLGESSPKEPTTVYGASKLVGEHYTLAFWKTSRIEATVVRPFNTYGPRSHIRGPYGEVIPRFAIQLLGGKAPTIFGDGSQTRDFTYVEDTARFILAAAERDELVGDTVNIGNGEEISVKELASTLGCLIGAYPKPRHLPDRPGDIHRLKADTGKFRKLFPDFRCVTFDEGLRRYLAWLKETRNDLKALADSLSDENWKMAV